MTDTPLSPAQLEARIRYLRAQRLAIEAELRHLLGTGRTRPRYHCLRCSADWEGLHANRRPAHCARCHTRYWDRERQRRKLKEPKRPTPVIVSLPRDGEWPWQRAAHDAGLPPPPLPSLPTSSAYVPLSTQFQRRLEEPQPESLIPLPTEPIQTESVVEATLESGPISGVAEKEVWDAINQFREAEEVPIVEETAPVVEPTDLQSGVNGE